jgi:hypothetical protein
VAGFFINVDTGRVATHGQLIDSGEASDRFPPERPWHPLQGPTEASTAVYAVLRKKVSGREREAWIGLLCIRHSERQAALEEQGWEEVTVDEIRAGAGGRPTG